MEYQTLGWDDAIPDDIRDEWLQFFREMFEIKKLKFQRCLKPKEAVGHPSLILFSDGSEDAYGACAYERWELTNGSFQSSLIAAKGRVAPLKRISFLRLELCGAVLSKRLRTFITREMRRNYVKEYFIVDSEIVRAMIQKESYGFSTFSALRIGEIQEETQPKDWYWVEGKENPADMTTRGTNRKKLAQRACGRKVQH